MRRTTTLLASLLLVLAVGCGTSGGEDAAEDEPTTTSTAATTDEEVTTTEGSDDEPTTTEGEPVDGASASDYEAAVITSLTSGEGGNLVLDQAEAECVAPQWVDAITVELLEDEGVAPEDLADPDFAIDGLGIDRDVAEALVAAFPDCDVDLLGEFAVTIAEDDEEAACIADNVDEDGFYELLTASFVGEDTDAGYEELYAGLVEACGLPE